MKKTHFRKIAISFIIAALAITSLLITSCGETEDSNQTVDFSYTTTDSTVAITGTGDFVGEGGALTIPSVIDGKTVTSIASGAFAENDEITSVTLPATIETIGSEAFRECESLKSINLPYGIKEIHSSAFEDCESLMEINFPANLSSIGDYAFKNCESLAVITITGNKVVIGTDVFEDCDSVESITVPAEFIGCIPTESLKTVIISSGTSIPENAFSDAEDLETVTLPASITEIGSNAFSSCEKIQNITASAKVIDSFHIADLKNLTIIGEMDSLELGKFSYCNQIESITLPFVGDKPSNAENTHFGYVFGATKASENAQYVPSTLKNITITGGDKIANDAFYGLSQVERILLPRSISSIGNSAFKFCTNLKIVNIPANVSVLGSEAFVGTSVDNITIPDKITVIKKDTFKDCKTLTSLTIGKNVSAIENDAFYGCDGLSALYISNLKNWCGIDFTDYAQNPLYYANVLYVGGKELTEFTIPADITRIGNNAFFGCSSIKKINTGATLTSIGAYAFASCNNLEELNIASGLREIGESAFSSCKKLTKLTLPESITEIGAYAFNNCAAIKILTLNAKISTIKNSTFRDCAAIETISLYSGITTVEADAFLRADNIRYANAPASVLNHINSRNLTSLTVNGGSAIDASALLGAAKLESVKIADSVSSIGNLAFKGCSKLSSIDFGAESKLSAIGESAFEGCSAITALTLPKDVKSIGESAFEGATKLIEIYNLSTLNLAPASTENGKVAYYALSVHASTDSPSDVTVTEDGFVFHVKDNNAIMAGYLGNKANLILPDSYLGNVYSINKFAFAGYQTLSSITIPNVIVNIGEGAFKDCNNVRSITATLDAIKHIPTASLESLTITGGSEITSELVKNSKTLKSITISASVKTIADDAFAGCTALASITVNSRNTAYKTHEGALYTKDGKTLIAYSVARESEETVILKTVTAINAYAFSESSSLSNVFYEGTKDDWKKITIGDNNDLLSDDTLVFYSATEPTDEDGYYWYYDEDMFPTFW